MVKMFVLVVVALLLVGCSDDVTPEPIELSPAQIKQQAMEDAAYYDSFVVVFNKAIDAGDKYAICNGTRRLVGLDAGEARRVELTSQEELNASLCQWNEESGRWGMVQDISGVSPGDYLLWDTSLHWTRYTP